MTCSSITKEIRALLGAINNYTEQSINPGRWVTTQHTQLKIKKNLDGKKSSLTEDRMYALNVIGFKWSVNKKKPKSA